MIVKTAVLYKGWKILAACLPLYTEGSCRTRFVGRSVAVLMDPGDESGWIDPNPQTSDIPGRRFSSGEACLAALIAQSRILIDAMKRQGGRRGKMRARRPHTFQSGASTV